MSIAFDVARRLIDPGTVSSAVASARAATQEPASIYWKPYALAQGDAGIALMYGCFDACFPDQGWDRVAHQWIERATHGIENQDRLPGGLHEGLSGLAFAVNYLSRDGRRYQKLLARLHEWVVQEIHAQCAALDSMLAAAAIPFAAWDVIAGLTGMGAYLLSRRDETNLTAILQRLVALTSDAEALPRWHTPAEFSGQWMREAYPDGHLNCGLAHGIPGPLALMSLARLADIIVPGLDQAIDRIATWLSEHRADDRWGMNWPSAVPLVRHDVGLLPNCSKDLTATHAGWCYGSPGIARALWLAGQARQSSAYCATALGAMGAVMRRSPSARGLMSPTLCHGFAGLLCITLRFRNEVPETSFSRFARALVRQIEVLHEPETLLGYRTTEPGGGRIDQAGLLDGAPGVAMALLAAATPQPPLWDRLLLLS